MMYRQGVFLAFISLFISGCTTLPAFGPSSDSFPAPAEHSGFSLVPLSPATILKLQQQPPMDSLANQVPAQIQTPAKAPTIANGERLQITIWEAVANGLFAASSGQPWQMEITVDDEGNLLLPFVGTITAAGLSLQQLQRQLQQALQPVAIDPQVVVGRNDPTANLITVGGDVNAPVRLPLPASGLRILDAIAQAGGTKADTFDATVTLIRRERLYSTRLTQLITDPISNLYLQPQDNLLIEHRPRTFSMFGALRDPSKYQMDEPDFSLSHALAQAGGLDDEKASAQNIFLFRFETTKHLQDLAAPVPSAQFKRGLPTIYHLDLSQPQAFFLASSLPMKHDDIVYISNSSASEFRKFIDLILAPIVIADDALDALSID